MSREVKFDKNAICDNCGAIGAYDFMGDYLCEKCAESDRYKHQVERIVRQLPENEWENCPNPYCDNTGAYPVEPDGDAQQCEFCWSNWRSVFFQRNKLYLNV